MINTNQLDYVHFFDIRRQTTVPDALSHSLSEYIHCASTAATRTERSPKRSCSWTSIRDHIRIAFKIRKNFKPTSYVIHSIVAFMRSFIGDASTTSETGECGMRFVLSPWQRFDIHANPQPTLDSRCSAKSRSSTLKKYFFAGFNKCLRYFFHPKIKFEREREREMYERERFSAERTKKPSTCSLYQFPRLSSISSYPHF